MKAISIRLEDELSKEFDELCQRTGYKKNTLLTRLIASFVQHQKELLKGKGRNKDPFAEVIGILQVDPMLTSPDVIDKTVYDL